MITTTRALLFLGFLSALAGCASDPLPTEPNPISDRRPKADSDDTDDKKRTTRSSEIPTGACTRDAECGAGTICKSGTCSVGCRRDSDCEATEACSDRLSCVAREEGCTSDAECARGEVCRATTTGSGRGSRCTEGCRTAADCGADMTCGRDNVCEVKRPKKGAGGDFCSRDEECQSGDCRELFGIGVCL